MPPSRLGSSGAPRRVTSWRRSLAHHYLEAVRPEDQDLAWAGEDARGRAAADRCRGLGTQGGRAGCRPLRDRRRVDAPPPGGRAGAGSWRAGRAVVRDRARERAEIRRRGVRGGHGESARIGCARGDSSIRSSPIRPSQRAGMWKRRLDDSLVEGWIERALTAAPSGTPARVRALAANAYWHDDLRRCPRGGDRSRPAGRRRASSPRASGALMSALAENDQFGDALEVAAARTTLLPRHRRSGSHCGRTDEPRGFLRERRPAGRRAGHGGPHGGNRRWPDRTPSSARPRDAAAVGIRRRGLGSGHGLGGSSRGLGRAQPRHALPVQRRGPADDRDWRGAWRRRCRGVAAGGQSQRDRHGRLRKDGLVMEVGTWRSRVAISGRYAEWSIRSSQRGCT